MSLVLLFEQASSEPENVNDSTLSLAVDLLHSNIGVNELLVEDAFVGITAGFSSIIQDLGVDLQPNAKCVYSYFMSASVVLDIISFTPIKFYTQFNSSINLDLFKNTPLKDNFDIRGRIVVGLSQEDREGALTESFDFGLYSVLVTPTILKSDLGSIACAGKILSGNMLFSVLEDKLFNKLISYCYNGNILTARNSINIISIRRSSIETQLPMAFASTIDMGILGARVVSSSEEAIFRGGFDISIFVDGIIVYPIEYKDYDNSLLEMRAEGVCI